VRALIVVVLLAACRAQHPAPFTLHVAVSGPLEPLGPESQLRSWTVIAQEWVFEPLVDIGRDGELVPLLAAKAEIVGPREIRVRIRAGALLSRRRKGQEPKDLMQTYIDRRSPSQVRVGH
jgi:hypothetical protein